MSYRMVFFELLQSTVHLPQSRRSQAQHRSIARLCVGRDTTHSQREQAGIMINHTNWHTSDILIVILQEKPVRMMQCDRCKTVLTVPSVRRQTRTERDPCKAQSKRTALAPYHKEANVQSNSPSRHQ
jgi:hypothetical protein